MILTAAFVSLAALPAALAANFTVVVGGAGGLIQYNPSYVEADVNDIVIFSFEQNNHTVTQSSLGAPCEALQGGFDTNFVPVASSVISGFPTVAYTVIDTNPTWFYCRQTGHCQKGMVFAINPGPDFGAFQAAAEASGTTTATAPAATTPAVVTVTATVTVGASAETTTYGSYPGSAEPTSLTSQNHMVTVGASNGLVLAYTPSNITAQPGDTVTFQFMAKNHTATQSSFAAPCRELASTSTTGQVGFDSGFNPVAVNATGTLPTYTIQINDTAPVWVYCRQTGHCGKGMVFSVNAISTGPNNFAAFQALAEQLNGTASTTTTSASPSSTSSSGASAQSISYGAGTVLALVSAVFGFLL